VNAKCIYSESLTVKDYSGPTGMAGRFKRNVKIVFFIKANIISIS